MNIPKNHNDQLPIREEMAEGIPFRVCFIQMEDFKRCANKVFSYMMEEDILRTRMADQEKMAAADKDAAVKDFTARASKKIYELKEQLNRADAEKELAVQKAVAERDLERQRQETQIQALKSQLAEQEKGFLQWEADVTEQHSLALRQKDEEIAFYKDLKARMMKFRHGGNVLRIAVAGVKIHDAGLQLFRQLGYAFIGFIGHEDSPCRLFRRLLYLVRRILRPGVDFHCDGIIPMYG